MGRGVGRRHPEKDERYTPRSLITDLHQEFSFTVDAASCAAAPSSQVIGRYWDKAANGLAQSWAGERVFCNPPFSSIPEWVKKAHENAPLRTPHWSQPRRADLIVMLVPANRTEQPWWHEYVEPQRDCDSGLQTRFLRGRTPFGNPGMPDRPKVGTPFGCVLLIWG